MIPTLSFSATGPLVGTKPRSGVPIKTFEKPRFPGDTGIYNYEHYMGCKKVTIDGVDFKRNCWGKLIPWEQRNVFDPNPFSF